MKMTEPQLKQKVKKIATNKNCNPQEIYKKLFFERFLVRLANSEVSDKFLFKGGNLLGYCIELGRQTRDLDFLATQIQTKNESICAIEVDDGFDLRLDKLNPITQNFTIILYKGLKDPLLRGTRRRRYSLYQLEDLFTKYTSSSQRSARFWGSGKLSTLSLASVHQSTSCIRWDSSSGDPPSS